MKLNNKQIKVLAEQVLEQVKKKTEETTISQKERKLAENATKKIQDIRKKQDELDKEETELYEKLSSQIGFNVDAPRYGEESVDRILKYKPSNLPRLSEIEDKIVLEAMFESKEDMKSFIDKLVKEFSK